MNQTIRNARLASLVACSLALIVVGCDKNKDMNSTPDANRSAGYDRAMDTKSTNTVARDADNTARNVRDRNDATLTPGDQGNTPADRETTQKIRKALVDSKDYSVIAQNVKIITTDGKVTLRGPVKSDAEKMGIVALAKSVAGNANVDDQLEVKTNP